MKKYDYHDNLARPVEALMQVLEENTDALYMYQYCLPGRLGKCAAMRTGEFHAEKCKNNKPQKIGMEEVA